MYKPEALNSARKWQHESYVGNKAKVEKQHIDITGGREPTYFSVQLKPKLSNHKKANPAE